MFNYLYKKYKVAVLKTSTWLSIKDSIQGPVSFGTHLEFPPLKLNANIVETNVGSRLCGRIHEDVSEIDRSGLTPNTTPAIIKTGDANVQVG